MPRKKPDEKIGLSLVLHLLQYWCGFSTFQFTTKQSTAPVVNHPVRENLDKSVEKLNTQERVGNLWKTMDKIRIASFAFL